MFKDYKYLLNRLNDNLKYPPYMFRGNQCVVSRENGIWEPDGNWVIKDYNRNHLFCSRSVYLAMMFFGKYEGLIQTT